MSDREWTEEDIREAMLDYAMDNGLSKTGAHKLTDELLGTGRHFKRTGTVPSGTATTEFKECAACAAKPGAPTLCDTCLHNRWLASTVPARLIVAEQVGDHRVEYGLPDHSLRDLTAMCIAAGLAASWNESWVRVRLDDPEPGCDVIHAIRVWAMTDALLAARGET